MARWKNKKIIGFSLGLGGLVVLGLFFILQGTGRREFQSSNAPRALASMTGNSIILCEKGSVPDTVGKLNGIISALSLQSINEGRRLVVSAPAFSTSQNAGYTCITLQKE